MSLNFEFLTGNEAGPKCLVCADDNTLQFVRIDQPPKIYTFFKCDKCLSLTSSPQPPLNIESYNQLGEAGWLHYVDIGAGIDFLIGALGKPTDKKKLIDVGCGYGFTIDFWNSYDSAGRALGVDESQMSVIGSEQLGFDLISPEEFQLSAVKADVIFASEVIEHVQNPIGFLDSLSSHLEVGNEGDFPIGEIVLTTPNAEYINANGDKSKVAAALSPGFHTTLLSRKSIGMLLMQMKVPPSNISVSAIEDRLLIQASWGHTSSKNFFKFEKTTTIAYLEKLVNSRNVRLAAGASFRLLDYYVNAAKWTNAEMNLNRLEDFLQNSFGIFDPYSKKLVLKKFKDTIQKKDLELFLKTFPAWYSSFLFYASQIRRNQNYPGEQAYLLEFAEELFRLELEIFPQFSQVQESLLKALPNRIDESGNFISFRYGGSASAKSFKNGLNIRMKEILKVTRIFKHR